MRTDHLKSGRNNDQPSRQEGEMSCRETRLQRNGQLLFPGEGTVALADSGERVGDCGIFVGESNPRRGKRGIVRAMREGDGLGGKRKGYCDENSVFSLVGGKAGGDSGIGESCCMGKTSGSKGRSGKRKVGRFA